MSVTLLAVLYVNYPIFGELYILLASCGCQLHGRSERTARAFSLET